MKQWSKSRIRETFRDALRENGLNPDVGSVTWLSKTWCKPRILWKGERLEDVMFRVAEVELSMDGKSTKKLITVERSGSWRIH